MIIWAGQRTGSSALETWLYNQDLKHRNLENYFLLDAEPSSYFSLEIFNQEFGIYRNNKNFNKIFEQDFISKVHPETSDENFILEIINNSRKHKNIILYREDPYDRLISLHCAQINDNYEHYLTPVDRFDIPVDVTKSIENEILLRERYNILLSHCHSEVKSISYEDIYVRKNLNKIRSLFPHYDSSLLLKRGRYPQSKLYNNIPNSAELKEKCLKLGRLSL